MIMNGCEYLCAPPRRPKGRKGASVSRPWQTTSRSAASFSRKASPKFSGSLTRPPGTGIFTIRPWPFVSCPGSFSFLDTLSTTRAGPLGNALPPPAGASAFHASSSRTRSAWPRVRWPDGRRVGGGRGRSSGCDSTDWSHHSVQDSRGKPLNNLS